MELYRREQGEGCAGRPPVVLLHGLFGAASNWLGVAPALAAAGHRLILPDLRNHGRSPHDAEMSYPAMAADVRTLIQQSGHDSATLIGHSMGGKVAMWLALSCPSLVERLVVVDMAPVRYPNRFAGLLGALQRLPLHTLDSRAAADRALAADIPNPALRGYLLQNLTKASGGWRWRFNLEALVCRIHGLMDFPQAAAGRQFPGDALFLHGAESDYVQPEHEPQIRRYFPFARHRAVPGAGHWLYSDQPELFTDAVTGFLADLACPT